MQINHFKAKVLWSQIDANYHLRHSAYADFCAQARVEVLEQVDFGMKEFTKLGIGPVLFKEELQYFKEVKPNEVIEIKTFLTSAEQSGRKWSFEQEFYRTDGELAAIIKVQGAWMDVQKRKLTTLPPEVLVKLKNIPRR